MRIIAITLYKRPSQTAKLFSHLLQCEGLENYSIRIAVDSPEDPFNDCNAEVLKLVDAFICENPKLDIQCFCDGVRRGIDVIKWFLLEKCYAQSPFVIFMEDDTWPHPQTLKFFETQYDLYKDDPHFVSITGYRYSAREDRLNVTESELKTLLDLRSSQKFESFRPWIWLIPKDVYYEFFGSHWEKYLEAFPNDYNSNHDTYVLQCMQKKPGSFSIEPLISYTLLLDAAENATHTPSQEWFMNNEYTYIHRGLLDAISK